MADGVERIHGYVLSALQQAGFDEVGVQGRSGPDHAGADVFLSATFYDENFESADICATWRSNEDDVPWLEAKIRYGELNRRDAPGGCQGHTRRSAEQRIS